MDDKSQKSKKSKKEEAEQKRADDLRSDKKSQLTDGAQICCFECMCSNKDLKGLTCCCCCPIACGVHTIALLILILTIFAFSEIFFMLLDDNIHWWYVGVACLTLIPAVIACFFAVNFFIANRPETRTKLMVACMLIIVAAVLFAIWNMVYFLCFYKRGEVKTGRKEVGGEWDSTVKIQIFYVLLVVAIICALFAYFICVTNTYADALKEEEEMMEKMEKDEEMEKMMDDKMMEDGMMD